MKGLPKTDIENFDYGWNFWTGCYGTGDPPRPCFYCWARPLGARFGRKDYYSGPVKYFTAKENEKWPYGFQPTFYPHRLDQPKHTKPGTVAVAFQGDLIAWAPREIIERAIEVMRACPELTFFMLTKAPQRYQEFRWPGNCWLGTTVTGPDDIWRSYILNDNNDGHANNIWVSIEPLLGEVLWGKGEMFLHPADWFVIGAMTGPLNHKHQPKLEWIQEVVTQAQKYEIQVWLKDSLKDIWPSELLKELPE